MEIEIDLSDVTEDEAAHIRVAIAMSDGKTLHIPYRRITDAGVVAIARFLPTSKLETLFISAGISDVGAIALAAALPCPKLTKLSIWGNGITDVGARALAGVLGKSHLTELILFSIRFTDVGVSVLAAALPTSKLTELYIFGTAITDVGARHFLTTVPSSKVTSIWLLTTHVSPAANLAIENAIAVRPQRDKLFLLLRLMVFWRSDGDNAMVHRIAGFLLG